MLALSGPVFCSYNFYDYACYTMQIDRKILNFRMKSTENLILKKWTTVNAKRNFVFGKKTSLC